ncbi:MAG TPA: right-handed parallel beta-helix repeat-containing protein [Candidatus Paceibacterota bacterium]|nr:right-handed parallel beta-helix repeat-containing protein [Candidatus Paceibacterota bacterium]
MKKVFPILFLLISIFLPSFIFASTISFPNKIDTLEERINIQVVLNSVLIPSPNLKVDGVLGRKSIQAIQSFQESRGLVPDGKVGPITRSALESSQSGTTTSTTTSSSSSSTATTVGCSSGSLFNTQTGQRCSTTTSTSLSGCTGTNKFSTTTGQSCSTTTVTTVVKKSGGGGGGSTSSSTSSSTSTTPTCTGSSTQSCTISNGTGTQSRTCNSGTWSSYGPCTVSSCNSGYQISGNACVATTCSGSSTQSCTITNGTGTQSRTCTNGTWSSYGTCTVSSCNSGYQISGNACVAIETIPAGITYYVDNTCSVNGNGKSQTCGVNGPFNSLMNAQAALTGNQGDNSLLLKRGQIFREQFTVNAYGVSGHQFTISSYGSGDKPIISGQGTNMLISCTNCKYITVDGIEIGTSLWYGLKISYPASNITIKNSYVHDSGYYGISIEDSGNNLIESNEVSWNDYYGIYLYKTPGTAQLLTNNTIINNKVHNNLRVGIISQANCPFPGTSVIPERINGTGNILSNNESYNNSSGIYLICTDNTEVHNNNLHDNGLICQGGECPFENYGLAVESGSNNYIHDNIISNSQAVGIGIYGDDGANNNPGPSNSNRLYRNVVYGTIADPASTLQPADIAFQCSSGQSVGNNNIIFDNIIIGRGWNIEIDDRNPITSGNLVYNNVFYGGIIGAYVWSDTTNKGWTFKNNIFADNRDYSVYATYTTSGMSFSNNLYYKSNAGTLVSYNNTNYNFANIVNLDSNAKITDPKFVGTSSWSDFRIQAGSPAIDAGQNLGTTYSNILDPNDTIWTPSLLNQNNYGLAWDIGAFIYY